jgi:multiple sugar transport system permease protein
MARTTTAPSAQAAATRGRRFSRSTSDSLWALFFIAPQLIGLIIFSLIPLVAAFALSLADWGGIGELTWVGFANYAEQFRSDELWIALRNTLLYAAITVPGGLILALLVALGLNNVRGKTIYRVFYFMPVVTSSVAVSVIWLYLLNGDFGIINTYARLWFGLELPNWLIDERFVIPAISILGIWWGLGFSMVIFLAGLQAIPRSLMEAAQMDGAGKLRTFWSVTLPLLSPTTFFLVIMALIAAFQVFDQAYVMTRGGPGKASYTMVFHIYQLAFQDFTFGKSSAAAVILFAIILAVTIFQLNMQKRWVHYED